MSTDIDSSATVPSAEGQGKKPLNLALVLRRVERGQKTLALVVGLIGVPTVVLTGYTAALNLKPEVAVMLNWAAKISDRTYVAQNAGAHSLYHFRSACGFFNVVGLGLPQRIANPANFDVPIVPPNGNASGLFTSCGKEPFVSDDPAFVAIGMCYEDAIPGHKGLGVFVFKRNLIASAASQPTAVPYVLVDAASDRRFVDFGNSIAETCRGA